MTSEEEIPRGHEWISKGLGQLEKWATIWTGLEDEEREKMAWFFLMSFQNLHAYHPDGTKEQQLDVLQRLTDLRQKPFGSHCEWKPLLDRVIAKRLMHVSGMKSENLGGVSSHAVSHTKFRSEVTC